MFSKKESITRAIIEKTKSENGYNAYSNYYNLPDKRILYLARDEDRSRTTLKIFSVDDLKTSIVERTFLSNKQGEYDLFCILPNGTILLAMCRYGNRGGSLIKICPNTLKILSTQSWQASVIDDNPAGVIDNESFFVINKSDVLDKNSGYFLTSYQWNTKHYVESRKTKLSLNPDETNSSTILSLGKHRYCCQFEGCKNNIFDVLIFKIDSKTYEIQELGLIKPVQYDGPGSFAFGYIAALPNRQLLTYHKEKKGAQIWDTDNLTCVKKLDWSTIQKPDKFMPLMEIIPFPDSRHLLISKYSSIFIFDTDKCFMKEIKLESQFNFDMVKKETVRVADCGNHHILGNGKVLAFVDSSVPDCNQMLFDLKEMCHYRKNLIDYKVSQLVSKSFFNKMKLPDEISSHILSYAFTPEIEASFVKGTSDEDEDERSNYIIS